MSLPVPPDTETILQNCIATLRDVIVPDAQDEWARFNAGLLVGALEYAIARLGDDRADQHRADLRTQVDQLRGTIEKAAHPHAVAALEATSPFEVASRLLVWGQNNPGDLADELRRVLHPVLYRQMESELEAAGPIMSAFERGMRGRL
ncbi:MAG: hypothetical protein QGH42_02725 [Kiritimatiellia bacterium]|jgi:hypothetical protein|nr:hypothetical protein [Pseudomonadales bacterium]MDP6473251.1 hypothetical protein [Pseudomonadales bacterium]MDP6829176.1 hypothetical protein [Pseudomonadales bacterium]MDP7023151.1 hypothetical protein [Kiritimatiellia bacterium]|tara:strand:+ start:232 stop:675 length:444 start_codon:yes stop_codon:yes gene_type:complete